ncbi:MAG: hypothetical protein JSW71_00450 [Gemmatimonadota bacterium]|nr:MAG: hypothetical protein JSW71_00450 [Gemmatimonadota bacterium]
MTLLAILMGVVLVLAVLSVIPRGTARPHESSSAAGSAGIDEDELARAEDELSDLGAMATPEDAAETVPDWGPGAPKYRRDTPDSHG